MDNRSGTDYTETNASTITFSAGLQVSDTVIVKSYSGSAPFTRFQFDITASSTSQISGTDANSRTLSVIPKYTEVFVNGVLVKKGQWNSGSGTTINFEEVTYRPKLCHRCNWLWIRYSRSQLILRYSTFPWW